MSNATDSLAAMLAQYEVNMNTLPETSSTNKFDLKNYFSTFLAKTEKSATRKIRILPMPDGSSPFVVMYGHKIQVDGEWKTFACLKEEQDGSPCPFCEAREELLAENTETGKTLAKNYSARKMYVIKVIDRDKEDEGVKFWRFPHDYRNTGTYDKIMSVIKNLKSDITNAVTGRDLFINLAKDSTGKTQIQSIVQDDSKPLSDNEELTKEWLGDTRIWQNVYSIKPYDYLFLIVSGEIPFWDKEAKKYVAKSKADGAESETNKLDTELTLGLAANVKPNIQTATASVATAKSTEAEEVEDDLPF